MSEIAGITQRDLRRLIGEDAKAIIENQTAMIQAMAQVSAGLIHDVTLLQRKYAELETRLLAIEHPQAQA